MTPLASPSRHECHYLGRVKLGWPKDRYRLLCYNCNIARARHGGRCPHEDGAGARLEEALSAEMDMDSTLRAELRTALPW